MARNRFLAEAMLNGLQSHQKPASKPRKYSVPTCHSTLKQMEQAKLAREFEQQRRMSNNNNDIIEDQRPKVTRSLSRTSSVGKLVNNFENGNFNNNEKMAKIIPAMMTKPPLATKPILRHTVSSFKMRKKAQVEVLTRHSGQNDHSLAHKNLHIF